MIPLHNRIQELRAELRLHDVARAAIQESDCASPEKYRSNRIAANAAANLFQAWHRNPRSIRMEPPHGRVSAVETDRLG